MIRNGFIINPYHELLPDFKICPFSNKDLLINRALPESDSIDDYFNSRFNKNKYIYTLNGREAIYLALKSYDLQPDDIVTIFTTSGNHYISSCVTREIEKFCKWSRVLEQNTKLLFVNHEFGYPYEQLQELKKHKLPIIEDCAHSFFSEDVENSIGTVGDFVIYSFPKMFPLQIGGLLLTHLNCELPESKLLEKAVKRYVKNVLSFYIPKKDKIIRKRLNNYSTLSQEFKKMGFIERFNVSDGIVPGVFMFRKAKTQIELPELKEYFYLNGIQCSVFYGEDTFYIPVNQSLNEHDLAFFVEVMKSFFK